ncbi:MAG: hypothetical protein HQL12_07515 [Candidatus Omnitrophica bacterium]|nr:hypothetical protein [Candidatus Omnitrophota bacterium]
MKKNNSPEIKQLVNLNQVPESLRKGLQSEAKRQIDRLIYRLKRYPLDESPSIYLNTHHLNSADEWQTHIILTLPSEIISVQEQSWDMPLPSLKKSFEL